MVDLSSIPTSHHLCTCSSSSLFFPVGSSQKSPASNKLSIHQLSNQTMQDACHSGLPLQRLFRRQRSQIGNTRRPADQLQKGDSNFFFSSLLRYLRKEGLTDEIRNFHPHRQRVKWHTHPGACPTTLKRVSQNFFLSSS